MNTEFSCLCTTRDGKLKLYDRAAFDAGLREFGNGVELELVVRKANRSRIRGQKANRYLWGVVYALMALHTGHSPEDIHEAMCERFLPSNRKHVEFFNEMTGEKLEVEIDPRRSSKLTGGPFYDFVESVRQFAREFLDVDTPDPDPEYWRKRGPVTA